MMPSDEAEEKKVLALGAVGGTLPGRSYSPSGASMQHNFSYEFHPWADQIPPLRIEGRSVLGWTPLLRYGTQIMIVCMTGRIQFILGILSRQQLVLMLGMWLV